jgi:hypothetical protein
MYLYYIILGYISVLFMKQIFHIIYCCSVTVIVMLFIFYWSLGFSLVLYTAVLNVLCSRFHMSLLLILLFLFSN